MAYWLSRNVFISNREEDYPYISGSTAKSEMCKYDATTQKAAVYVRGYETLPHNDYDAVISHLGKVGPLSIALDASSWGGYEGGVFDGCPYEKNIEINHGVQVTNNQYIKNV